ncbi:MAG: molecular chaperone TorD family protein [Deltaproteobacteria bacterium]|nr:molecular chaperone TorD family protein [Deltaproteobacteria bacterium]
MIQSDGNRDRAHVYAMLALLFHTPGPRLLTELREEKLDELRAALARLGADKQLFGALDELTSSLATATAESLERCYAETFEPAGGLRCPPNETAHTADTPQHALVKTFELADIAGFYRAFGVEVEPGTERPDHIAVELEFMHLLAVKELVAGQSGGQEEQAQICREAQRAFLKDHLGRWSGRLRERLAMTAEGPFYAAAGELLERFVVSDAARLGSDAGERTAARTA